MWPNLQETRDLVTYTEEIFSGKTHFCALGRLNLTACEKKPQSIITAYLE